MAQKCRPAYAVPGGHRQGVGVEATPVSLFRAEGLPAQTSDAADRGQHDAGEFVHKDRHGISYECASSIWGTTHRQQPLQCITDGGAKSLAGSIAHAGTNGPISTRCKNANPKGSPSAPS